MSAGWWFGLVIPMLFSVVAVRTGKYGFKAAVTGSCLLLLIGCRFATGAPAFPIWPLLAAFGCSIVGDAFLSHKEKRESFYLYGIVGYFLAHAFYLVFALTRPGRPVPAAVLFLLLLILFTVYYRKRLAPHVDGLPMKVALYAYLLVSCVTFPFAVTSAAELVTRVAMAAGIGLIVFSDICIGETDFAGNRKVQGWILPTYYLAHLLLTVSVLAEMAAG